MPIKTKTSFLLLALVLLVATSAFTGEGKETHAQFGLGLYYDCIFALESPLQLRLGLYTPSGFTLEVSGGQGYYLANTKFNLGYTWRLDESHEYAFLVGLSYAAAADGSSLSPTAYVSYRSCRFSLGSFDDFIDIPFLWYGVYIGYTFRALFSTNGFEQSGLDIGTMLEYRF